MATKKETKKKNDHGDGSIREKTINGKIYLEGRIMIEGVSYPVSGKTEKEIKQKFKQIQVLGPPKKKTKTTVKDWIEKWLENEIKPAKKISTYLNYSGCAKSYIYPDCEKILLEKFSRADAQKLINKRINSETVNKKKGLSPNTIRRIYLIMSAAFNIAVKDGLIEKNPMEYVEIPKIEKKKIETINKENLQKIINHDTTGDPVATLSQILLLTGLRRGEGLGLKWTDVDFKNNTVSIQRAVIRGDKEILVSTPKNKSSIREAPLPKIAIEILQKHRKYQLTEKKKFDKIYNNQGWIFATPDGNLLHPDTVRRGLHRLLKAVGVPLTNVHALRHSYASLLFELGESGKVIQSVLGHSSIKTTMDIYVRVQEETKKDAADKIDSLLK